MLFIAMHMLLFVRDRGGDVGNSLSTGPPPPPTSRILDDSNLSCDHGLVEGLRQNQVKR